MLRVGCHESNSMAFVKVHPVIIHGITKLLIKTEHLRLWHAGPTHLAASIRCCFHMVQSHMNVLNSVPSAYVML